MNCDNCGAPMRLIRDRDYFFCEYCGTFHFPTPSAEGIRLLGESPDDLHCPVCQATLQIATIDGWQGFHCANCRGILIDQDSFRDLLKFRRSRVPGPPDPPRRLDQRELKRQIFCPLCKQTLNTHPYYGPGNFVIDSCSRCRVVWLDHGELDIATDAPGRDRHDG